MNIDDYSLKIDKDFSNGFIRGAVFNFWSLPYVYEDYSKLAGCVTGAGIQFAALSSVCEFWPNQTIHGLLIAGVGLAGELYLENTENLS